MFSSKFSEDGGKLKEEFVNSETQFFPYLFDMVGDHKSGKNPDRTNLSQILYWQGYSHTVHLFIFLSCFMMFRPELQEYIPNNEMCLLVLEAMPYDTGFQSHMHSTCIATATQA